MARGIPEQLAILAAIKAAMLAAKGLGRVESVI